jgi:hypothetical protein
VPIILYRQWFVIYTGTLYWEHPGYHDVALTHSNWEWHIEKIILWQEIAKPSRKAAVICSQFGKKSIVASHLMFPNVNSSLNNFWDKKI